MENEMKKFGKKRFLKLLLIAAGIFAAMCLCALSGYRFVRNKAPQEEILPHGAQNSNGQTATSSTVPFHLPYSTKENAPEDFTATSKTEQNVVVYDKNDYLVIAEGDNVNLYVLTHDGEKVFSDVLSISPASLTPEDRANLEAGIILSSSEELSLLLEDYTS